jgi:hypothetical protein
MATKEQRRARFMQEAYELARSGRHRDYLSIQAELSGIYPEAREWLDMNSVRIELRRMCENARKESGDAPRS